MFGDIQNLDGFAVFIIMEGWIKLHRKFLEWEWFNDDNMVRLFIYLLLSVNNKPKNWHGIEVKRGQLITGLTSLSEKTKISVRSIRTCINRLKSTGELTVETTNKYSIITICKYDDYQATINQNDRQNDRQPDKQTTNKRQTNDNKQEVKEYKELKEDKNTPPTPSKGELIFPFSGDEFMKLWTEWNEQPKLKKKPLSAHQKILKKLSKYDEQFACLLLEDAIAGSYQGCVFPSTDQRYYDWKKTKGQINGRHFSEKMSFADLQNLGEYGEVKF